MFDDLKIKNSTNTWFILLLGLMTVLIIVSYARLPKDHVNFINPEVETVFNLLVSLLFIAWLIESLLEVLQKILVIDKDKLIDINTKKSPEIAKFTSRVGFLLGVFIALAGIHTIQVFFALDEQAEPIQELLFYLADTVLTAGVLAAGSKGIHELTNTYKGLMQAIQHQTQQSSTNAENSIAVVNRE